MNAKKATIVQICPCFVDLERESGGVANVVRQLCLRLAQDFRVVLICGNRELGVSKSGARSFDVEPNLRVHIVAQHSNPLLGPTRAVRQILRTVEPPLVGHVHTCFSALTETAMFGLNRLGFPCVFTPHGKLNVQTLRNHRVAKYLWWNLVAKRAISRSARIVVMGVSEQTMIRALGLRNRTSVIPNGFDAASLVEAKVAPMTPLVPKPYVLFLGYLDPRKQPDLLVRAFSRAQARKTHKLVLAGPDTYNSRWRVQREIVRLHMEEEVSLFGPVYGQNKWHLLRGATCLCLPSLAEGFPLVVSEAIAVGVPSVISGECNVPEIGECGAGLVVHGFDPIVWANAIDRISLDPAIRNGMSKCALRMASHYQWENLISRWQSQYEVCLSEHGAVEAEHGTNEHLRE